MGTHGSLQRNQFHWRLAALSTDIGEKWTCGVVAIEAGQLIITIIPGLIASTAFLWWTECVTRWQIFELD